jgi:hypothetical protein
MSEMAAATPPFLRRPRERTSGTWSLRTQLELGALGGAVPCARLHTRQVLWEWGLSGLGEPAELIVSELVTNAVQASARTGATAPADDGTGPGYGPEPLGVPAVWLWLASDGRRVLIEVGDNSPRPPAPAESGHDIEGGRGLLLVGSLSQGWGHYSPADDVGDGQRKFVRKIVWALLADS